MKLNSLKINLNKLNYEIRRYNNYKICVIGGGPSGFYSIKYLLDNKINKNIKIDLIDKLPIPFGLVRYGVAPDHPEVKSVIEQFIEVCYFVFYFCF